MKKILWMCLCGIVASLAACEIDKDKKEEGDEPVDPPVEVPEAYSYLVNSIVRVQETVVASTGEREIDTETYSYTYDELNRIVKVREDETLNNGSKEYREEYYTYEGRKIFSRSSSSYDNDEVDDAVYTLGTDDNIIDYKIQEFESGSRSWETKGSLFYDSDGYVMAAAMTVVNSDNETEDERDEAVWKDGNLVRVYDEYLGEGRENVYSEMSYENPEYVNNPDINLDLNFVVCDTEWLDCFAFSGRYIKPYGHIGKRSKNYMTREYDSSNGNYFIYEYEFDERGLPVKVRKKRYEAQEKPYFSKDEITYTITYKTVQ